MRRWQKIRFIAMLLCCVLLVNMSTGAITSYATGTASGNTGVRTQATMHLNANGGEFTLLQNGTQSIPHRAWGQTFDVGTALRSNNVTMNQISWGENELLGWKRFEGIEDSTGNFVPTDIGDDKLYTTDEVFDYIITADYGIVTFVAQWDMVDTGSGDDTGNDENTGSDDNNQSTPVNPVKSVNVKFDGGGGVFKAYLKTATEGIDRTHSSWGTSIAEGTKVGDIVSVGDVTCDGHTLQGWYVGHFESAVEPGSIQFVKNENTLYQLEDIMKYTVPANYYYDELVFMAIWEENSGSAGGNTSGPVLPENHINIGFDGNGGSFKAYLKSDTEADDRTHAYWGNMIEKGTIVGDTVSMGDATFGENTLMCWIMGHNVTADDGTVMFERIGDSNYQLADILGYTVPADYAYDNLIFVAQWNMTGSGDNTGDDSGYNGEKFILNANGGYMTIHRNIGTEEFDYEPRLLSYWSGVDTLADAMVRSNDSLRLIEREGYDFAGWKLYSFESGQTVQVDKGVVPEAGEKTTTIYVGSMICEDNTGNRIEKDEYVLLESAVLVTESIPMEKLFEEKTDKGLYAEAIWKEKPRDYNAPVFEGMTIGYDADNNKILIDVKAYDADSDAWGMSLQLADEKGKKYWIYENDIRTNPYRVEYSADKLVNGTYYLRYINVYDRSSNRFEENFFDNTYVVEVTHSSYVCPIAVKDVVPSKNKVEVSKDKSEAVTITVELSKGQDILVKDSSKNNRVGYMTYWNSGYIDLYQDEDGKLIGTYNVDWLNNSETDYVHKIYLCTELNAETGDANYEVFEYDYDNVLGAIKIINDTPWSGNMNSGPFRVTDLTVIDKSTDKALENGTFYDITDGKTYTLAFSLVTEEVLPEDTSLELILMPGVSNYDRRWVYLDRQDDGKTYTGEVVINRNMGCTEYSVAAMALGRGDVSHWYYFNYNVQPYFNVKSNGDFVADARTLKVNLYSYAGNSPELLFEKEISLEGHPTLTVEDIVGGTDAYAALVEKTKRSDGSVCDGWVDAIYTGASTNYYESKDVINLYHQQSNLTLWTTYPESEVQVSFQYFDEKGEWFTSILSPVTVEKGTTLKEILNMLQAEGRVPTPPAKGEYKFVDWDLTNYMNGQQKFSHNWHITIPAGYTIPSYWVWTEQYVNDSTYKYVSEVMLLEKNVTVKDLIEKLEKPYVPVGDTFLRWEIVGKCWVDGNMVDWQDDMLLSEYGCPNFRAVYQSMITADDDDDDDDDDVAVATPTPTPTPAPTATPAAKPVVKPNITPVEPTVTEAPTATPAPAIVTPPGVELSEEKVAEKVEQITQVLESLKAPEASASTAEKPIIVLDMKTENNATATIVPVEVLEVIKGQDVDVVLDMGGYSWTVNGADIKATELASINLEVKVDADAIPSKLVDTLADGAPATQLSLTHNGDFGFKASLTVNLGAENAGQFGNMYYYDSDNRLVFMNAGKIDDQGNVELSFSHASDYVVVVGEEVVADEGTVYVESNGKLVASAKEEVAEKPEKSEESSEVKVVVDSDAEGNNNGAVVVVIIILVIALAAIAVVLMMKRNKK